jgi:hypothetical protein
MSTYAMISRYRGSYAVYVRSGSGGRSGRPYQHIPTYAEAREFVAAHSDWTLVRSWSEAEALEGVLN